MVVFDNQKQKYEFLDFKKILKKKYLAKPYYYIGLCDDEREAFEFALRYNEGENSDNLVTRTVVTSENQDVQDKNLMPYLLSAYLIILFVAWELFIFYVATINSVMGGMLGVLFISTLYFWDILLNEVSNNEVA